MKENGSTSSAQALQALENTLVDLCDKGPTAQGLVFPADIGHEIRTALTGILKITALLEATRLDEQQKDHIRSIRFSTDAVLALINDILDFSDIASGAVKLAAVPFDLHDTVEGTADLVAAGVQQKPLEVAVLIDTPVPKQVVGDPARLRQVLVNLGTTALKLTESGEIVFVVKKRPTTNDSTVIEFEISYTGTEPAKTKPGTPSPAPDRADGAVTRATGNLGLAISRHLAGLMGGDITVASGRDRGNTFRFTCRFDTPASLSGSSFSATDSIQGMRCLVVGDDPTGHKVLDWYIHRWGGVCKHCDSRKDAVQWLETSARALPFDAVITDFLHGNPHKYKTIAAAIRQEACAATVPLLCLIPRERTGDASFLRHYGYHAYLTKPVRQVHLYNALTSIRNRTVENNPGVPGDTRLSAPSPEETPAYKGHALVVDDNPVNRKVLVAMLTRHKISCDVVENGKQAVAACARKHYDLVFMDCLMPVMDGYEATKKIREARKALPIIAITADVVPETRDRCLAAGMNDYITKPFKMQDLLDMTDRYLKESK
ncbi:response regulator [Desulfosudis oleivorans]|uniref:histidine kinase n=1 Tax=Desulfosudis oleivorans (strain DSM 6200 / JCM 39069 / Hxd3) TaxID=96561 RepID=A8ZZV0_DESOH|nr:response regulator [Desulfosudis oleivorans]ABW67350.1 histidine kinase [Desulfosudis oleivorans Hxd3]